VIATPPALPVPRCHTQDLAVSLGRGGVGLGNAEVPVSLRNRSGHSCFVFGYAGFGLEDAQHRVQPSRVHWGGTYFGADTGARRVVLRPGARAETLLAWGLNAAPDEPQRGPCEPQTAWLEVTPPDERTHLLVRFKAVVCSHGRLDSPALHAPR
jgi:hypothetical protein